MREAEEATRLLYVAATRARDLLVVPVVGDERYPGLAAGADAGGLPGSVAGAGAGDPGAARVSGVRGGQRAGAAGKRADSSGCRRARTARASVGAHRVVWWDPTTLALGAQESAGLAQQKILTADEQGVRAEEGTRAHAAWQAERARVREVGGTPSRRVVTATERALFGEGAAEEVVVESVDVVPSRPHGKRFGTLVHAVLAAVELDADRAGVADAAAMHGRLLGATEEEVEAAVETVVRALAHPLMRRAAEAARVGRCRREVPVAVVASDGVVVEGVVDAAFVDAGGWTVVDFKTDVEIAGRVRGVSEAGGVVCGGGGEGDGGKGEGGVAAGVRQALSCGRRATTTAPARAPESP